MMLRGLAMNLYSFFFFFIQFRQFRTVSEMYNIYIWYIDTTRILYIYYYIGVRTHIIIIYCLASNSWPEQKKKTYINMPPPGTFRIHPHLKVIFRMKIFVCVRILGKRIDAHIIMYRSA